MNNQPIGVFDSGVGGLTIVPSLLKRLPNERLIYFGDTARTPYGSKAVSTIKKFTEEIVDFLLEKKVKMIAIACNTVTSACLEELQVKYPDIPMVGVIEPAVKKIIKNFKADAKIGIIGTKVTINNNAYSNAIQKYNSGFTVYEKACPIFVPLIEEGLMDNEITDLAVKHYLEEFDQERKIDALVLGCTHYPLIKKTISRTLPGVEIIDPSYEMVCGIEKTLKENDLLADNPKTDNIIYASDLSPNFTNMINSIFKDKVRVGVKNFDLLVEELPHF